MKKIVLIIVFLITCSCPAQTIAYTFNVYFDYNKTTLSEESKTVLDSVCRLMKGASYEAVLVNGYTDGRGTDEQNHLVSSRREQSVIDYLRPANPKQKITVDVPAEKLKTGLPDRLLRRVMVRIGLACGRPAGGGFKTEFTGIYGTKVTSVSYSNPWVSPNSVKIEEFFSTEDMIKNEWYALDTEGNILRTWGMIEINGEPSDDGEYLVKIPMSGNDDPSLSIWIAGNDPDRPVRWKNTDIKITREKGYYVFRIASGSLGRGNGSSGGNNKIRINLDKQMGVAVNGNGKKYKTVYIATHKPINFKFVKVGGAGGGISFSAKINDTLWAFTAPASTNLKPMAFKGNYWEDNMVKEMSIPLKQCMLKFDAKKNPIYYICKSCQKRVVTKELNKKGIKKEKGFWAWVRRTFGGDK